jgi:large subunit ribosomal protein L24
MAHAHVRRGDLVEVIKGKNKAPKDAAPTRGKVLRVLPDEGRVLVEKVNMIKKHQRPTQKLRQGGIIEREGLLALSNVLLVCSRCDRPVRSGTKILADGRKTRVCRRCGESIDKG